MWASVIELKSELVIKLSYVNKVEECLNLFCLCFFPLNMLTSDIGLQSLSLKVLQ